jgi:hypothetical protein
MAGEGSIGIVLSTALNINYNSKYQAFNWGKTYQSRVKRLKAASTAFCRSLVKIAVLYRNKAHGLLTFDVTTFIIRWSEELQRKKIRKTTTL